MNERVLALFLVACALFFVVAGCEPENDTSPTDAAEEPVLLASAVPAEGTATVDRDVVWVMTAPRLTLPGGIVSVTGYGFQPGETVDITVLDGGGRQVAGPLPVKPDPRGALPTTTLQLPAELEAGEYTVAAEGEESLYTGKVILWVRSSAPALAVSQASVRPEETVTITGGGFAPWERVVVYFEGRGSDPLTALAADAQGDIRAENVRVPIVPPGDERLVAAGSVSLVQARQNIRILQFDPVAMTNANIVPPGEAIGVFGYGFAARDSVEVWLEGSSVRPVPVQTDDKGRLNAPKIVASGGDSEGAHTLSLRTERTGRTIRVPFQIKRSFPLVELGNYFGSSASDIVISVRYLRPRERLEVFFGEGAQRKKVATFRADDNGWLPAESRFRIPQDVGPGRTTISMVGEADRPALVVGYFVSR